MELRNIATTRFGIPDSQVTYLAEQTGPSTARAIPRWAATSL
jgi:hypothetical protein